MTNKDNAPKGNEEISTDANISTAKSRRNFLTKTVVGATIASIPAHSVWAGRLISGNMSGNVSGWAECNALAIWSHGKFKTNSNSNGDGQIYTSFHTQKWSEVFGLDYAPFDDGDNEKTLEFFINENTINSQLAAMYINASLSGTEGVWWPVVKDSEGNGTFDSTYLYARYLWEQVDMHGSSTVNTQLSAIISEHHAGGEGLKATCI